MDLTCLLHWPVITQETQKIQCDTCRHGTATNAAVMPDADVCQALIWGTPDHDHDHLSWQRLAEFVEQRRAGRQRAPWLFRHEHGGDF